MANTKISALTGATTPLAGTETLPIVQGAATKNVSVANLTAGRTVSTASTTATGQMSAGTATPAANVVLTLQESSTLSAAIQMANRNSTQLWKVAVDAAAVDDKLLAITDASGGQVVATFAPTTGNITFSLGNLVQGTAAKGINFTANTPAAGKTSQLLNWYEEGTWTPVMTSASGTLTTVGTCVGTYTRVGREVTVRFDCTITTNGTGSGAINISGLPFTSANFSSGSCRDASTNITCGFTINTSGTIINYITKYDGTYPGANGSRFIGTCTYQV